MVKLRRGVQHTTSASAAFTDTNVIVLIDELGPPQNRATNAMMSRDTCQRCPETPHL